MSGIVREIMFNIESVFIAVTFCCMA